MKFNGKTLTPAEPELFVIPHGEDLLPFRIQAVGSFKEFNTLCPEPKPPMRLYRGEKQSRPYLEDKNYQKAIEHHGALRMAWLAIESLKATDLEWERVKLDDPTTWELWREELEESLSEITVLTLMGKIAEVNGMDDKKYKEAKDLFIQSQAQDQK